MNDGKILAVDYSRLTVLLWRCCQDLNERVKQLEATQKQKKKCFFLRKNYLSSIG